MKDKEIEKLKEEIEKLKEENVTLKTELENISLAIRSISQLINKEGKEAHNKALYASLSYARTDDQNYKQSVLVSDAKSRALIGTSDMLKTLLREQ